VLVLVGHALACPAERQLGHRNAKHFRPSGGCDQSIGYLNAVGQSVLFDEGDGSVFNKLLACILDVNYHTIC
jgi:hypothetical protein